MCKYFFYFWKIWLCFECKIFGFEIGNWEFEIQLKTNIKWDLRDAKRILELPLFRLILFRKFKPLEETRWLLLKSF